MVSCLVCRDAAISVVWCCVLWRGVVCQCHYVAVQCSAAVTMQEGIDPHTKLLHLLILFLYLSHRSPHYGTVLYCTVLYFTALCHAVPSCTVELRAYILHYTTPQVCERSERHCGFLRQPGGPLLRALRTPSSPLLCTPGGCRGRGPAGLGGRDRGSVPHC